MLIKNSCNNLIKHENNKFDLLKKLKNNFSSKKK